MKTTFDPHATMRAARATYFAVNAFGEDGGYGDAWVDFQLGPVPFPFPNTRARLAALAYHDLHHIVTGYDTDTRGEFEISAWELGGGCRDFTAAWVLNLAGVAGGVLSAPVRTFRAFARGLRCETLYGRDVDALLAMRVADARSLTRADAPASSEASASDLALFVATAALGLAVGTVLMSVMVPLAPLGYAVGKLARRRAMKTAAASASA